MAEKLLRTLAEQVEPKHTALLIIDPQKDFCAPDGALARIFRQDVSRIPDAVNRLNIFIQKARQAGVLVVWVRLVISDDKRRPNVKAMRGDGDAIMVAREGSDGINWYSEIVQPLPTEHIVTKWSYDAFADTELDLLLSSKGVKTLLFTGFATNVCVETTARDGYIKGYYVVLVSDCTEAYTRQEYESAVFNIKTYFGKVATTNDVIRIWKSVPE